MLETAVQKDRTEDRSEHRRLMAMKAATPIPIATVSTEQQS